MREEKIVKGIIGIVEDLTLEEWACISEGIKKYLWSKQKEIKFDDTEKLEEILVYELNNPNIVKERLLKAILNEIE